MENNFMNKYEFAEANNLKESTAYKKLESALKIAQLEEPNIEWTKNVGKGGSATKYYNTEILNYISGTNVTRIVKAYSKVQRKNNLLERDVERLVAQLTLANTKITNLEDSQINLIETINNISQSLIDKIENRDKEIYKSMKIKSNMLDFIYANVPEEIILEANFSEDSELNENDIQKIIEDKHDSEELEDDYISFLTNTYIDKSSMAKLIKKYSVPIKENDLNSKLEKTLSKIENVLNNDPLSKE